MQQTAADPLNATDRQVAADPQSPANPQITLAIHTGRSRPVQKSGIRFAPANTSECRFQACHACRPFLQDRLYASFNAVLENELRPLTARDIPSLRVLDASVLRNIGSRQPGLSPSALPPLRTDALRYAEDGDSPDESTPATQTTSSHTSDFLDDFDSDATSASAHYPIYTEDRRCAYGYEADQRQRSFYDVSQQAWSSSPFERPHLSYGRSVTNLKASSISLPERLSMPFGSGNTATHGRSSPRQTTTSENNNTDSGEEVEVDGGLALTEEAVVARVPDIKDDVS